jgi:Asp-tRNA(Asn)/Glu-tRNA(Gln) amidotransferase A subunit family amidase
MLERTITITRGGRPTEVPYVSGVFWTILTNLAHLPTTTFPAGVGARSGLPCGLNIVSRSV